MKLSLAVVSSNENEDYLSCFPIVKEMWNKIVGIDCKLILVASQIPEKYMKYKDDIILFKPIKKIHTTFISQCIRYLYPALMNNIDGGIIVSDIDMVPLNKDYFINSIHTFNNTDFVSYRDVVLKDNQIVICYNVALYHVYSSIFNINTENDIVNLLKKWYNDIKFDGKHGGKGWNTDQKLLYDYVMKWNNITKSYKYLSDDITNFRRLSRGNPYIENILNNENSEIIKNNKYCDFHMLMPFYKYENDNIKIIKYLMNE